MTVRFNTGDVDGPTVFYRSACDRSAPIVLLLHGFPSASHMFRELIPELADKYHPVAPDLPGFGMTSSSPAAISPTPSITSPSNSAASPRCWVRDFLTQQTILLQYTQGVSDPTLVSSDQRKLDDFDLARRGNDEIQLDLLGDYKIHVALYGEIQDYLRNKRPPVLAIWGKNDPFFVPHGRRGAPAAAPGSPYATFPDGD